MRHLLIILLALLGFGALAGGGVLIASPSGNLFGMPLSMLAHSPFKTFLLPGIILFIVLGVMPVIITVALIKKPVNKFAERFNFCSDMYWGWTYAVYTAFALIIWIQTEMILMQAIHWLHSVYMCLGLIILIVALFPQVRNFYKK